MAKAFKFRVKAGTHKENGKTYTAGQIVKTNNDLASVFREKFERVYSKGEVHDEELPEEDVQEEAQEEEGEPEASEEGTEEESTESPDEVKSVLGKNVTHQFPEAGDLLVFKKGVKFFIADSSQPDVPLNSNKPLITKKQAEAYLASLLQP